ncbi:carboxylic ester hydrolase [Favolaschia claudopus]|uniref:Carboxylic ester hydrolase n=1 Tax=Favolaschia claudopus TaxID=2862362 RepID=A0AAV9ZG31_9AGAR
MTPLALPAANLIEIVILSFLYGIYLSSLGIAAHIELTTESGRRWKRLSEIRKLIIVVSVLLLVNSTIDLVVVVMGGMKTLTEGPAVAFDLSVRYQTLIKTFCVVFQTLVGDGILMYRCWVLYDESKIVGSAAILLWFTNFGFAIRAMVILSQAKVELILSIIIQPWMRSFWSVTIAVNILATSLIVMRIWVVERDTRRLRCNLDWSQGTRQTMLGRAMRNIVESGAIYTCASIFTLGSYAAQSNVLYIASAVEIHSVGIAFNLIILRCARSGGEKGTSTVPTHSIDFGGMSTQAAANTAFSGDDAEKNVTESPAPTPIDKQADYV